MSTSSVKVEIIDMKYDIESDLVFMKVKFIEKDFIRQFCWPSYDLSSALGIKAKVPTELWGGFCENMKGKSINMVCEITGDPESPFITNSQMNQYFDKLSENPNKYDNFFG